IGHVPQSRIGLETHFHGPKRPIVEHRWENLLSWLTRTGLCSDGVRRDLRDWVGTSHPDASWPEDLLRVANFFGSSNSMCFLRGLHHVKISYEPGHGLQAKGYIGFKRHWTDGTPANAEESPRVRPRVRKSSWRGRIEESPSAGLEFLAACRNAAGWWEDFQLVSGVSDAW